jgi:hypothetical protein
MDRQTYVLISISIDTIQARQEVVLYGGWLVACGGEAGMDDGRGARRRGS